MDGKIIENIVKDKRLTWLLDKKSKSSSWVGYLILGVVSIAFIAIIYFKLWKNGKQLAKARHERDVLEEEKRQLQEKIRIDKIEEGITSNVAELISLNVEIEKAENKEAEILKEYRLNKAKIDAINNWKDFNSYVNDINDDG